MFVLRRAALRALSSSSSHPSLVVSQSSRLIPSRTHAPSLLSLSSSQRSFSLSARRRYAAEDEDEKKSAAAAAQETAEGAKETVEDAAEQAKDRVSSMLESARETAQAAASAAPSFGVGENAPSGALRGQSPAFNADERGQRGTGRMEPRRPADPSPTIYVGNLYFEVLEQTLEKEFERFGAIKQVKIVYDPRGLSKGFGYVEFQDQAAADEALRTMNQQVLEGRRLTVQYAARRPDPRNPPAMTRDPSSTLFIGNMSYDMTDKDLNELFRSVKNVVDVRVAIDRRTGQPRGFAHADFVDVASAETAAEYLRDKEFYGRRLRVDYSTGDSSKRNIPKREAPSASS